MRISFFHSFLGPNTVKPPFFHTEKGGDQLGHVLICQEKNPAGIGTASVHYMEQIRCRAS
ncbi:hypothetical protein BBR01nite_43350 [Brevibacillus brevis]|nr:hypothetical protein BBR01nite_43350 [Brevibacillus brevis]